MCEVPGVAVMQAVNDSRRAWRNYFDSRAGKRKGRKVGRPRMKSKKDHRQSFRLTRNGFSVRPNRSVVCGEGGRGAGPLVAQTAQRPIRASRSSANRTAITTPAGRGRAGRLAAGGAARSRCRCRDHAAGDDRRHDGARTDIANPKHLARKLGKLRRLEREKSRRQKGSHRTDKTRRKVALADGTREGRTCLPRAPCGIAHSPHLGW